MHSTVLLSLHATFPAHRTPSQTHSPVLTCRKFTTSSPRHLPILHASLSYPSCTYDLISSSSHRTLNTHCLFFRWTFVPPILPILPAPSPRWKPPSCLRGDTYAVYLAQSLTPQSIKVYLYGFALSTSSQASQTPCLSIYLSFCLSVCLSVCLVFQAACLPACLSVCLSVGLSPSHKHYHTCICTHTSIHIHTHTHVPMCYNFLLCVTRADVDTWRINIIIYNPLTQIPRLGIQVSDSYLSCFCVFVGYSTSLGYTWVAGLCFYVCTSLGSVPYTCNSKIKNICMQTLHIHVYICTRWMQA